MDFKVFLTRFKAELEQFEANARKLENQNLGDIVASVHGKLGQALSHPDIDAAVTHHTAEATPEVQQAQVAG